MLSLKETFLSRTRVIVGVSKWAGFSINLPKCLLSINKIKIGIKWKDSLCKSLLKAYLKLNVRVVSGWLLIKGYSCGKIIFPENCERWCLVYKFIE